MTAPRQYMQREDNLIARCGVPAQWYGAKLAVSYVIVDRVFSLVKGIYEPGDMMRLSYEIPLSLFVGVVVGGAVGGLLGAGVMSVRAFNRMRRGDE